MICLCLLLKYFGFGVGIGASVGFRGANPVAEACSLVNCSPVLSRILCLYVGCMNSCEDYVRYYAIMHTVGCMEGFRRVRVKKNEGECWRNAGDLQFIGSSTRHDGIKMHCTIKAKLPKAIQVEVTLHPSSLPEILPV